MVMVRRGQGGNVCAVSEVGLDLVSLLTPEAGMRSHCHKGLL